MPDDNKTMLTFSPATLMSLYQRLFSAYGHQHWWPAQSPFEVIVGAVLTQNTSWINVEKAIANLQAADRMDLERLHVLDHESLASLIRPSGYFNIKSRRLKNLCVWIIAEGGMDALNKLPTLQLRTGLLSVNGIGPETADDILLYAFYRPVFVIDSYTRRLLTKLGLIEGAEPYEVLRAGFESNLAPDQALFNEYHALIVRHAKQKCQLLPECVHCQVEGPIQ